MTKLLFKTKSNLKKVHTELKKLIPICKTCKIIMTNETKKTGKLCKECYMENQRIKSRKRYNYIKKTVGITTKKRKERQTYYQKNKEKMLLNATLRNQKNKQELVEYQKLYFQKNKTPKEKMRMVLRQLKKKTKKVKPIRNRRKKNDWTCKICNVYCEIPFRTNQHKLSKNHIKKCNQQ